MNNDISINISINTYLSYLSTMTLNGINIFLKKYQEVPYHTDAPNFTIDQSFLWVKQYASKLLFQNPDTYGEDNMLSP